MVSISVGRFYFNPHSPCGERLCCHFISPPSGKFQSTLPMRGATNISFVTLICQAISIHTPHAGSDPDGAENKHPFQTISIHTPHAGSDKVCIYIFANQQDFNPHSPCGERPFSPTFSDHLEGISIHTPHAGSDSP